MSDFKKYQLEIYPPGEEDAAIGTFESDAPFMGISKGDVFSTMSMNHNPPDSEHRLIEVKLLYHIIYNDTHKIVIHTKETAQDYSERKP